jgi:hypothetical protein
MYQRVVVPAAVAVAAWLAKELGSAAIAMVQGIAWDRALPRHIVGSHLPRLPLDWAVLLAVFLAMGMCKARGGTRRESIMVGVAPLVIGGLLYLALAVTYVGIYAFAPMSGVAQNRITVGGAVMSDTYLVNLLGLAGVCLGAIWLHLRSQRQGELPPVRAA